MHDEIFQGATPVLAGVDAASTYRYLLVAERHRDALLAFAGVLDGKLAAIAHTHAIAEPLVREACALYRLPSTSSAHWQGWNWLRAETGCKFHTPFDAVSHAMARTPRSSSLVESLNPRLRSYFTLRRHLGGSYLDLLRFFVNHRRFMRSRHAERQGKSPRELMTGQGHPQLSVKHLFQRWAAPWLTVIGVRRYERRHRHIAESCDQAGT